jgi:hypothetical protein
MAKIDLSKISARMTPKAARGTADAPHAPSGAEATYAPCAANAMPTPNGAPPQNGGTNADLGQLREILFGAALKESEQEVARVETRVAMESARVRSEFGDFGRRLEERITEIDARSSKSLSDLREQLLAQSNLLSDAIQERNEQVILHVNKGLQELKQSKIDRTAFSNLLFTLGATLAKEAEAAITEPEAKVSPDPAR